MDTHKNAPLTPKGREMMVRAVLDRGLPKAAAARQFNTTPKTVGKWVERFRAQGADGLKDRSSRPLSSPSQTAPAACAAVEALRRRRYTAKQIAAEVGVSPATVSRILRRFGLNKLSALEPAEPIRRHERDHPGVDPPRHQEARTHRPVEHRVTERSAGVVNRHHGIGWEYVHVCIDDASRVAFVQVMPSERKESAVSFLMVATAYFGRLGRPRRTCDDGQRFVLPVEDLPRRLQTNRSATGLHETLHAEDKRKGGAIYPNRASRMGLRASLPELRSAAELHNWLHRYNWHRPHGSLKANTPISRLGQSRTTS